ncbi:MAG: DegT/DnrJ/EryC1/StrS family aminotransferase [Chloroflexi bacterium]|nr:DegT/DnrJ/EryC1/StrS family aminotransferase [Chloroflexota bacterium]
MSSSIASTKADSKIPLVDLQAQYRSIQSEVDAAIRRVLDRSSFILGDEVLAFESAFAKHVGATGAVGVSSGTAALQLALRALGVSRGDEVITTAHTFIATAEAISNIGAVPVFVDIDPVTYNIDPAEIEAKISERTRAILPVHLYGQPADMTAIMAIAEERGLWVVEDAAQAHGAAIDGRRCGSIGHLACFSFYPGKNLGAYGDAGAVTGNDPEVLDRIRRMRDHGRTTKYEHVEVGYAERIDALHAAVLGAKLPHLESWTDARRSHARRYSELLEGAMVEVPVTRDGFRHVFHLYVVRSARRDELLARLREEGIGAGIHYPIPLHRQPAYVALGYGDVSLPHTEAAAAEVLSLPMYPELTDEQIQRIVATVRASVA